MNKLIKHTCLAVISVALLLATGCSPMDDTYYDFIKDGPVFYLTKIPFDSLQVQGGRNRVQITLKNLKDSRATRFFISWSNGKDSLITDLNKDGDTKVMIDNMREGSFFFTCRLEDHDGNKSLHTDLPGTIYGETYEKYLTNRIINKTELVEENLEITFVTLNDNKVIASSLTWLKNGTETTGIFYYDGTNKIILEDFNGDTFKMKTLYKAEPNVLDDLWSKEEVIVIN